MLLQQRSHWVATSLVLQNHNSGPCNEYLIVVRRLKCIMDKFMKNFKVNKNLRFVYIKYVVVVCLDQGSPNFFVRGPQGNTEHVGGRTFYVM